MYDYLKRAKELEEDILKDRRHIHRNPEVGDELPETCKYVTERLKQMGYEPRRCARYGVLAEAGQGEKLFLLRADMDALPMAEESGLPFASSYPDRAHTCGHDTHVAMLLGAARMLKENEAELKGRVRLMFQPNEEGLFGAVDMIADHALDDVDAAMALHIDATMPLGYLTRGRGCAFASNDFFDIVITGKGGHAARPADAVDPINVMSYIQMGIQTLISREATPTETNVISITDGQIFLETDLFNQGVRPAINVGISVSRVGGNAQIKAMKKVAGTLKIDQAQYRELEAFSKFSSDMDPITALTIDKGRKNAQLLIQPQYSPMPVEQQIAILYCGTHGLLHDVPLDKVQDFERSFIESLQLNHQQDVLDVLKTGVIDDSVTNAIEETAAMVAKQYL